MFDFRGGGGGGPAFHFDEDSYDPAPAIEPGVIAGNYTGEEFRNFKYFIPNKFHPQVGSEKATLIVLVRNRELQDTLSTMKQIENGFNRKFHYPYTFLNDEPFTEEFIKLTTLMASSRTEYALIPQFDWSTPDWIDQGKFMETRQRMASHGVIYGESEPYRKMCRFNSGFFWRQKVTMKYDWYWRMEPATHFYCDLPYDPFAYLKEHNKIYGFVQSLPEYLETVETLWPTTQQFIKDNPAFLHPNASLHFVSNNEKYQRLHELFQKVDYNLCHFWSNFEIGSLQFFRSPAYQKYFDYLDQVGGFFYERWGDAPVHSLAVALFAGKEQLHWFADIGYKHNPWGRWPIDNFSYEKGRCVIHEDRGKSFDNDPYSCIPKWREVAGMPPRPTKGFAGEETLLTVHPYRS
ncbi:glycosyl transferase [Ascobolus immersus RN42]|uniref:Glycosyl transferase n=1 Tax=Ascobolus immersus RN42 TaxID=1160509 RepID=A0A3N4I1X0_ASCIM|nr:glycosyl transferase [Ascobolus immersus RN42]